MLVGHGHLGERLHGSRCGEQQARAVDHHRDCCRRPRGGRFARPAWRRCRQTKGVGRHALGRHCGHGCTAAAGGPISGRTYRRDGGERLHRAGDIGCGRRLVTAAVEAGRHQHPQHRQTEHRADGSSGRQQAAAHHEGWFRHRPLGLAEFGRVTPDAFMGRQRCGRIGRRRVTGPVEVVTPGVVTLIASLHEGARVVMALAEGRSPLPGRPPGRPSPVAPPRSPLPGRDDWRLRCRS